MARKLSLPYDLLSELEAGRGPETVSSKVTAIRALMGFGVQGFHQMVRFTGPQAAVRNALQYMKEKIPAAAIPPEKIDYHDFLNAAYLFTCKIAKNNCLHENIRDGAVDAMEAFAAKPGNELSPLQQLIATYRNRAARRGAHPA